MHDKCVTLFKFDVPEKEGGPDLMVSGNGYMQKRDAESVKT